MHPSSIDSLPPGLVWLRALIQRSPESASRTVDVKPHAALARFQPGGLTLEDYEQHLLTGLPAGTITRLVQRNANIQRVDAAESLVRRAGPGRQHRVLPAEQRALASSEPRGDRVGSRTARARGLSGSLQGQVSAAHRRHRSRSRPVTPRWSSCRTCVPRARPTGWSRGPARC